MPHGNLSGQLALCIGGMADERNKRDLIENQHSSSSSQELQDRARSVETVLDDIRETLARVRASIQKVREYLNRPEQPGR
jgi:hypothetical protein